MFIDQSKFLEQVTAGVKAGARKPAQNPLTMTDADIFQKQSRVIQDNYQSLKEAYEAMPDISADVQRKTAQFNETEFATAFNNCNNFLERMDLELADFSELLPQFAIKYQKMKLETQTQLAKLRNRFRNDGISILSAEKQKDKQQKYQLVQLALKNI